MTVCYFDYKHNTLIDKKMATTAMQTATSKRPLQETATHAIKKTKKRKMKVEEDDCPPRSSDDEASDADENGNLIGFIADETDEETLVKEPETKEDEQKELLQDLKEDERKALEEARAADRAGGPRRSRRARKEPKRFFHPDYVKTFLEKGGEISVDDVADVYAASDSSENEQVSSDDEEYTPGSGDDKSEQEDLLGFGC